MKTKKKNPIDATMRNVQAANKKLRAIERRLDTHKIYLRFIEERLQAVEKKMKGKK